MVVRALALLVMRRMLGVVAGWSPGTKDVLATLAKPLRVVGECRKLESGVRDIGMHDLLPHRGSVGPAGGQGRVPSLSLIVGRRITE